MTENSQPQSSREYTYVADAELARRLTRAFFRKTLLSRGTLFGGAILLLAVIFFVIVTDGIARTAVILITVILALAAVSVYRAQFKQVLAQFRMSSPAGGTLGVKIGDEQLEFVSPLGSSQSSYATYESIAVQDTVVFLKQRASNIMYLSPIELFPGDSVDAIGERITNSAPDGLPKSH